ncbi:MAG: AAA family ATPase [Phycisphaerales bacterium]
MRTIAIINQKGGCGKTTTAINLAGVLASAGKRTLLVDLDPQGHCAAGLAIPEQRVDVHIGDAMLASAEATIDWTRLLWRISRCLDLAPSTVRLAGLEAPRGGLAGAEDAEARLERVLTRLADQYDVCLIDCSPAIGMLTFNALVAAQEILIPVETAFFALQGASKQVATIKSLSKRLGVSPTYRLVPTMHHPETALSRDVLEEIGRKFGDSLAPVVVRYDDKLREAASFGQPVVEYAPESVGAEDYLALGRFVLDNPPARGAARRVPMPTPEVAPLPESETKQVTVSSIAASAVLSTGRRGRKPKASEALSVGLTQSQLDAATSRIAEVATELSHFNGSAATAVAEPAPITSAEAAIAAAQAARASLETLAARTADLAKRATKLARRGPIVEIEASPVKTERTSTTLFGVFKTSMGLLFVQPRTLGRHVCIAGDFNAWQPDSARMKVNEDLGVLELLLPLPSGEHQYRLVADGQWMTDPHNPFTIPNSFGTLNSVATMG